MSAGNASWTPLTSPGLALLLAALLTAASWTRFGAQARQALTRAIKPVAAVVLFLLMSQAMVQGGLVATLADALTGLDARLGLVLVAAMGLASGYMTGSNLSGNALLMTPVNRRG